MVREEVEEVRWELGALDAYVPAQGKAVVEVGGKERRVVTAELHA